MESRQLAAICSKIYQRFPDLKGVQPKVQDYQGTQVLLVFKGSALTADGRSIPRTVRVVASPDGKITKVSTSK